MFACWSQGIVVEGVGSLLMSEGEVRSLGGVDVRSAAPAGCCG